MSDTPIKKDAVGWNWIARMAWRDSRGQRRLLLLFTFCIVFGVGAVVAIQSLRANLSQIIEVQARALLGADLVLQTRQPYTESTQRWMERLGGVQSSEVRFRSMAFSLDADASRLVEVRALQGIFPLYGAMETEPSALGENLRDWSDGALVEESLMLQWGLSPGDELQLGDQSFIVRGSLIRISGESEVTGFFAPRIYIRQDDLESTGLIQRGSIVRYRQFFRFDDGLTEWHQQQLDEARTTRFTDEGIRSERVADRQRSLEQVMNNLFDFLNLIGFVALLLGGIGVGSAVHVFLQGKTEHMALLRCMGASASVAFRIYWLQVVVVGFIGALVGAVMGVLVQFWLPRPLQSFLPFEVEVVLSPSGILSGFIFGWLIATLFAFYPLLIIRKVSPLSLLRASVNERIRIHRDPGFALVTLSLFIVLVVFSIQQSTRWIHGLAFVGGLMVSLAVLGLLAIGLRALLRRVGKLGGPHLWRLGLSNLYRPNNRTVLLIVTLGMGVMLIHTLFLVREALLTQIQGSDTAGAANVILLDIQPDQIDALSTFLRERDYPLVDKLPVVTMRVSHLAGRDMRSLREDPDANVAGWIFNWEFRTTYRDHVLKNAEVIAGEFIPYYDGLEPFPISVTENVLEDMQLSLGDSITWNVQGIPVETTIASVRRVRWEAGRQNFNIVFPLGTIEDAPTIFAVTLFSGSRLDSAQLQNEVVRQFPNVSLIDLSLIFETVNEVLDRAAFVIKFMAAFTIATGLTVLAGSILTSRYQRMRESVLLRTLGASGSFVRQLIGIEFIILGSLAAVAGIGLSMIAAALVLQGIFDLPMSWDPLALVLTVVSIILLTLVTGLLTSRGIAGKPPLAVLREA
jgi:putative ABC transport system permease protein